MKLVTCMGMVYRLTDAAYKRMAEHLAAGGEMYDLGTTKGCFELGVIQADITDITEDKRASFRMEIPGYSEYAEYQKVKERMGL